MDNEHLQQLDNDSTDFELIVKDADDILEELEFNTEEDKLLCSSIITSMEKTIANNIKADKCVNIPFIGCMRKNVVTKTIRQNKKNFKLAKTELSKEEYKEHVKCYVRDVIEQQKNNEHERILLKKIKGRCRKKYDILYKTLGKEYAELYIRALSWIKHIPFDQEIQDAYDNLNKKE